MVVITDFELGDGDGLEILAMVRKMDCDKKTKVIVMTGTIIEEQLSRARAANPDGLLLKPFELRMLENTLIRLGLLTLALIAKVV